MWIIMLSGVEWDTLTDAQKELHCTMRASWLSSYSKASHSVLQHWFWKLLKDKTKGFAPLHKVFAKSRSTRPTVVLLPGRKFSSCTLSGHRCLQPCWTRLLVKMLFLHAFGKIMMRKKTLLSLYVKVGNDNYKTTLETILEPANNKVLSFRGLRSLMFLGS
jgi:hypothetical protein